MLAPFPTLDEVTAAIPRIVDERRRSADPRVHRHDHAGGDHRARRASTSASRQEIKDTALAYLVVMMEQTSEDRLDEDVGRARRAARRARRDRRLRAPGRRGRAAHRRAREELLGREGEQRRRHRRRRRAACRRSPSSWPRSPRSRSEHGSWIAGCGHAGDGNVHLSVFQPDPELRKQVLRDLFADGHGARRRDLRRARHRAGEEASTSSSSRTR